MNYLKRIFFVVVIFLVISFIISMFLPSVLTIEESVLIDNDKEIIQKQLAQFQLNELLDYPIDKDNVNWELAELEHGIEVSSSLTFDFGFHPTSKFIALFDKDELQQRLGHHLDSLKSYIENLPKIHRVKVEKKFFEQPQWFLSIRDTINQQEMSNIHGKLYAQINQYMDKKGIVSDSPPLVIYHLWTDSLVDIEAGIPISDSTIVVDNLIKLNKIDSGNIVTAIHYGSYDRLPETYFGINEWMRKNKVFVTGPPWESYLTDPSEENNPEKWQTAIFFPIK